MQLGRVVGPTSDASGSSSVEEATFMVARGVRRSWETAPIRACLSWSVSSSTWDRRACWRSWARSIASAAWLTKVPNKRPVGA